MRALCGVVSVCVALACGFDAGGTTPTNDSLGAGSSSGGVPGSTDDPAEPKPGTSGPTSASTSSAVTTLTTAGATDSSTTTSGSPNEDTGSESSDGKTGESSSSSSSGEPPPTWAYARRLTIGGDALGLSDAVMDIPLPVELDDTRISYDNAAADGRDLRFIDELSGSSLPYEIEVWDASGTSVVWIEVPVVSDDAPTHIEMRYGNPAADDGQDAAAVWSNDYVMVHHLAAGCAGFVDATGAGHNAGCVDITDENHGLARFGDGMSFAGDGHLQVPDHPDFDLGTALTFEAMVFVTEDTLAGGGSRRAVEKGEQFRLLPERGGGGGGIRATVWSDGGSTRNASADPSPVGWHHLVGVGVGDDEVRVYLDGVLEDTSGASGALDLVDDEIRIGNTMVGAIDEVRIAGVARSDDWVLLQGTAAMDALIAYGAEIEL